VLDLDQARSVADDIHQDIAVRQCGADIAKRILWVFGFEFVAFLGHLAINLRGVLALVVHSLKPELGGLLAVGANQSSDRWLIHLEI